MIRVVKLLQSGPWNDNLADLIFMVKIQTGRSNASQVGKHSWSPRRAMPMPIPTPTPTPTRPTWPEVTGVARKPGAPWPAGAPCPPWATWARCETWARCARLAGRTSRARRGDPASTPAGIGVMLCYATDCLDLATMMVERAQTGFRLVLRCGRGSGGRRGRRAGPVCRRGDTRAVHSTSMPLTVYQGRRGVRPIA